MNCTRFLVNGKCQLHPEGIDCGLTDTINEGADMTKAVKPERGLKARLIRDGIKKYPHLKPRELAAQLAEDHKDAGVEFRAVDVSQAKTAMKKKGDEGEEEASPAVAPTAPRPTTDSATAPGGLVPADVAALATLARRAGGVTPLIEMLQALQAFPGK